MRTWMVSVVTLAAAFATSALARAQENLPGPEPTPGDGEADGDVDTDADFDGGGDSVRFGSTRLPVPYVERPLTLPEMTLAPEASFTTTHVDFGGPTSFTAFIAGVGATFGITDDIMVEATPISVVFGDPPFEYGYFLAGITARFLEDPLEMGGRFRFIVNNEGDLGFNLGLPMRVHAGIVRLDTGVHSLLRVPTGNAPPGVDNDPTVALADIDRNFFTQDAGIPARIAVQVVDPFWIGGGTGFGIGDFAEAGDTIFVPLRFNAGGTIADNDGPLVDIEGGFAFPLFITSQPFLDTVTTEFWQFGVTGTGYLEF